MSRSYWARVLSLIAMPFSVRRFAMSFRVYPRSIAVMITETFSETARWSIGAQLSLLGQRLQLCHGLCHAVRVRAAGRAVEATGLRLLFLLCIRQFSSCGVAFKTSDGNSKKKKREIGYIAIT
jgi:hypothetical protein